MVVLVWAIQKNLGRKTRGRERGSRRGEEKRKKDLRETNRQLVRLVPVGKEEDHIGNQPSVKMKQRRGKVSREEREIATGRTRPSFRLTLQRVQEELG